MALFGFLKAKQSQDEPPGRAGQADRGILVFENTGEVIQAEKLLKNKRWTYGSWAPRRKSVWGVSWLSSFL